MPRLLLLRHAKSGWDDPGIADIHRPLSKRGRRAAPAMAAFMRSAGFLPRLVLCSAAARTRETWDLVAPVLGRPVVHYRHAIYEAPADRLLRIVRALPDCPCVLLVGHNPGLEDLASILASADSDPTARERLDEKFPTAALAVLDLPGRWLDAGPGTARLAALVRPRDLADCHGKG